jgi:hypothetical protein
MLTQASPKLTCKFPRKKLSTPSFCCFYVETVFLYPWAMSFDVYRVYTSCKEIWLAQPKIKPMSISIVYLDLVPNRSSHVQESFDPFDFG